MDYLIVTGDVFKVVLNGVSREFDSREEVDIYLNQEGYNPDEFE